MILSGVNRQTFPQKFHWLTPNQCNSFIHNNNPKSKPIISRIVFMLLSLSVSLLSISFSMNLADSFFLCWADFGFHFVVCPCMDYTRVLLLSRSSFHFNLFRAPLNVIPSSNFSSASILHDRFLYIIILHSPTWEFHCQPSASTFTLIAKISKQLIHTLLEPVPSGKIPHWKSNYSKLIKLS